MDQLETILEAGFETLGLPLTQQAEQAFRTYYESLEETNKVMNLTAISGEKDVAELHFLDCAAILRAENLTGKSVIDVGTGAGFPGLVLKIACPEIRLTLLDSLDKRIGFLRGVCQRLELDEVRCVHARAEEAPAEFREHFDAATSRAVARLNLLAELCLPLVRPGGAFIAMKSTDTDAELKEAKRGISMLGGTVERVWDYEIPGTGVVHRAVVIRKTGHTPARYPRRWAQIKKQPL